MSRPTPLHVLVVDDSATVREVMQQVLSKDGTMRVVVASDPIIAMRKMEQARPDVILLDLAMPRMDGLSFLRKMMATDPIPVVVCSALAGDATDMALRALEEGAVDVVAKPRVGLRDFLHESVTLLVDALHGAANATLQSRRRPTPPPPAKLFSVSRRMPNAHAVVAIGASTGGTEALHVVLEALPADAPGIVVVQHMPAGFTAAFANRLRSSCKIEVKEAQHGDRVTTGRALIAPGGRHMVVRRVEGEYRVAIADGPLVTRHRPSVDVLFRSVAEAAGRAAVGIILTGMGDDGAEGMAAMRERGAVTIAQDEATSVVFGMPKEAIARGVVDEVLPLPRIASALLERAGRAAPRSQGVGKWGSPQ